MPLIGLFTDLRLFIFLGGKLGKTGHCETNPISRKLMNSSRNSGYMTFLSEFFRANRG